jgi:beta-glucosidase
MCNGQRKGLLRMKVLLVFALSLSAVASAQTEAKRYLDPASTAHERAVDLVGRLTLDEKVSQMGNGAAAVPRLGVAAYDFWNEGLHGVARSGYATMFPQAIGMAATWDAPLLHEIGNVISTEARAKSNHALKEGNHDIYYGLSFWSPNINIFRDPRWGRGQETYGEDPFLTGTLAKNFIHGLQGDDPKYYKTIATPKHFAVHSGPESDRHRFNVAPSKHDLWDTYLPQFRMAIVDAKADSIMCAYNRVDGAPACGSEMLLGEVLRKDWKFQGFVTSDCGAIDDFFRQGAHMTEPDEQHAAKAALLVGTDTNCGGTYGQLGAAVKSGLIKESDIDVSLVRLFEARMRLGEFDPESQVPYKRIPFSAVHSAENEAVAKRAADESIVLLKNDGILPLVKGKYKTVAVIGPNAASLLALEGNYNGTPHDPVMPVDAVTAALGGAKVVYAPGSPYVDGFAMPAARTMLHPAMGSAENGLKAEYFAGDTFAGRPVVSRIDPEVNFDWANVNPVAKDGFSVRWSGAISAPVAGSHTFTLHVADCDQCAAAKQGYKVKVDGAEVASGAKPETAHFAVDFVEGQEHELEIEFERSSDRYGAGISLEWTPPVDALLPGALKAAKDADLVVAMLGLSPNLEGEEMPVKLPGFAGGDRTDIELPAAQKKLLEQIAATGKPLVVVLLNGSALATAYADEHANALLEAWYPGEAGAKAIADTLVGKNNPSGRLPLTFYASVDQLPAFTDYSMKGRTYRYFEGKAGYEFGYGLSYTKFSYGALKLSKDTVHAGDAVVAEVSVKNTGAREGQEVAELYLTAPKDGNGGLSPKVQLVAFQRVELKAGESKMVKFTLEPRVLSEVDAQGERAVQAGSYQLAVGGAQPGDAKAPTEAKTVSFRIEGTQVLPK